MYLRIVTNVKLIFQLETACIVIYFPTVPPRINHHSPDVFAVAGSDARLYCNATGKPTPTISWFKYYDRNGSRRGRKGTPQYHPKVIHLGSACEIYQ